MPDNFFDPLFGKPPCWYAQGDCLPGCEYGYAGSCERNRLINEDKEADWMDITPVGSDYEIQWSEKAQTHRHRALGLRLHGQQDRRWGDRKWIVGLPPREIGPVNDNVEDGIEEAMAALDRSVQEVTETVQEFRQSMRKLSKALNFLFWCFVALGICLLALAWGRSL